jgi:Siphovirus Gp157
MTPTINESSQQLTLFRIVDDLQTWHETLAMVEAQLAESLPDDERLELQRSHSEIEAQIETIGAQLAGKTDAIAGVVRRMGIEQDLVKAEEMRLHARRKTLERAEVWLRAYVVRVMLDKGIRNLKTPSNTIFLRGSEAVVIEDAEKVPVQYKEASLKLPLWLWNRILQLALQRAEDLEALETIAQISTVRHSETCSLSAIKRAIKGGTEVPGADVDFHESLVIR